MKFLFVLCAYVCLQVSGTAAEADGAVFLLGEFRAGASTIPFKPELTLSAAIKSVGGYTDFAATPIYVIRDGTILLKSYGKKIFDDDAPNNVALKAGDVIH